MNIRYLLIGCFGLMGSSHLHAQAPEPWWFDVEVIVFKRTLDAPVAEQFEQAPSVPQNYTYDLTSKVLKPNITGVLRGLPLCNINSNPSKSVDQIVLEYEQWQQRLAAETDPLTTNETEIVAASSLETDNPEENSLSNEQLQDKQIGLLAGQSQAIEVTQRDENLSLEPLNVQTDSFVDQVNIETSTDNLIEPGTSAADKIAQTIDTISQLAIDQQRFIDNAASLPPISLKQRFDCLADDDIQRVNSQFYMVDAHLPELDRIPKRIEGNNWFLPQQPHLLPIKEQQLVEFANKIERLRGHDILHHTVWRQEVAFGRDIAPSMRLTAGENLMASFLASQTSTALIDDTAMVNAESGEQNYIEPPTDVFSRLQKALADDSMVVDVQAMLATTNETQVEATENVNSVWEIDGEFKVFLQYLNGVPYLHIDSELVFQQPLMSNDENTELQVQRIPFKQLRRVISQQIHYFDHPLFGVVVQIRRHQRPSPSDAPAAFNTNIQ